MSGERNTIEVGRLRVDAEAGELTRLVNRAYGELAEMGLRYVATWQDEAITRRRVDSGECWVAREAGRIVGTILFQDAASTRGCPWYDRPEVASFHQFAVEPKLQRRGIGSRLLATAERRARETGAGELALDTAESARHLIALYEDKGYRHVGEADWEPTNYRSVILSKRIPRVEERQT